MSDKKIKVMIVDDHMVVRRGLSHVIQTFSDIELVAEAEGGEEALLRCRQYQPDVVLMDVKMEGMDGIASTQAIRKFYPNTNVIALSTFHDKALVEQMLAAGAIGYLLKNVGLKELGQAIRAACLGQGSLAPEAAQSLKTAAPPAESGDTELTERQLQVLGLMVAGLSNVEISERLTISLSTARFHVSTILAKLNVSNRTEAVALAIKNGLVTD